MKEYYNYVFHFNYHKQLWNAIPRDLYKEYWNEPDDTRIIKAERIESLLEVITRMERIGVL